MSFETAKMLVNCFVIGRINYCNSLLAGIGIHRCTVDRLQCVMNATAGRKCYHVSGLICARFRWLAVFDNIQIDAWINASLRHHHIFIYYNVV